MEGQFPLNLVMMSGGDFCENWKILGRLSELLKKHRPGRHDWQLTYIPTSSYGAEREFSEIVEALNPWGVEKFLFLPLEQNPHPLLFEELWKSDVIFLGWGNTFRLGMALRQQKIFTKLQEYAARGGILMGLSAGAITMCSSIKMAAVPSFDRDENEVHLNEWNGLDLVKFHFFPHYDGTLRYDRELLAFSRQENQYILAVPEGSGIVFDDGQMQIIGEIFSFANGRKSEIKPSLWPKFSVVGRDSKL